MLKAPLSLGAIVLRPFYISKPTRSLFEKGHKWYMRFASPAETPLSVPHRNFAQSNLSSALNMAANHSFSLDDYVFPLMSNSSATFHRPILSNDTLAYRISRSYFRRELSISFLLEKILHFLYYVLSALWPLVWPLFIRFGVVMVKVWDLCSTSIGSSQVLLEHDTELAKCVAQWHVKRFHLNSNAKSLLGSVNHVLRGVPVKKDRMIRTQASSKRLRVVPFDGAEQTDHSIAYDALLRSRYAFWYHRRFFPLELDHVPDSKAAVGDHAQRGTKYIRISCIGRSTAPVRALIAQAYAEHGHELKTKTSVFRAEPCYWSEVASKPSRPLETVILEAAEKKRIVDDITEYLKAESRTWYTNRGIPWRRGYCLEGPPGTGKTSLSYSLAGHLGLNLYTVSLQGSEMDDHTLASLFDNLPSYCIVLLEDIDCAAIRTRVAPKLSRGRRGRSTAGRRARAAVPTPPSSDQISQAGEGEGSGDDDEPVPNPYGKSSGRVSLAGLLNVIDGVSSQEGRVLIMTTNHVETLDPALLRPGRIDLQIKFTLATKVQMRDMFIRMYLPLEGERQHLGPSQQKEPCPTCGGCPNCEGQNKQEEQAKRYKERIESLAAEFAEICNADCFSPAEIQGFLLDKKGDPEAAVADSEQWCLEMMRKQDGV